MRLCNEETWLAKRADNFVPIVWQKKECSNFLMWSPVGHFAKGKDEKPSKSGFVWWHKDVCVRIHLTALISKTIAVKCTRCLCILHRRSAFHKNTHCCKWQPIPLNWVSKSFINDKDCISSEDYSSFVAFDCLLPVLERVGRAANTFHGSGLTQNNGWWDFLTGDSLFIRVLWMHPRFCTAASAKQHVSQHKKWFFGFSKLLKSFSNLLNALSAAHTSPHILCTKWHSQSFSNSLKALSAICWKYLCQICLQNYM